MNGDRKIRAIAIVALCVSILGLSIAYATLRASLEVTGTATVKANDNTWNVAITSTTTPEVGGTASVTSGPTVSGTTATFAVDLQAPGDYVEFDLVVTNGGILDAEVSAITLIGDENENNVIYTVTPKSGVTVGSALSANGGTHTYTIRVAFDSEAESLPNADEVLNLGLTLGYVQAS